ncbi:hypothetical protein LCGC14_3132070 [marine sediment metagenome]|uniref:Uncharacterized protein n=1 Tax=marine sediment metagenome TaxID=412755 RepID=A0A0F8WN82_9ZZZZ
MNVYECIYNWKGEVHTLFTSARSKVQAKGNTMRRLADQLGVNLGILRKEFDGQKDNWKVVEK